jgi:hypothetical protein
MTRHRATEQPPQSLPTRLRARLRTLVANSPYREVWKERISRQGAKHAKKSAILR